MTDWTATLIKGYEAALAGMSRKTCPYPKSKDRKDDNNWRLRWAWEIGYSYLKPNEKTPIEHFFAPHFGGPLKRDRKIDARARERIREGRSFVSNEFEPFPLPFYKPENYLENGVPTEWNQVYQEHLVDDGIYDVTDIPFHYIEDAETMEDRITSDGLEFVQKHGPDNIYIANGYQVVGILLFAGRPRKIKRNKVLGSFGHGACALFADCPKSILIVAEDD